MYLEKTVDLINLLPRFNLLKLRKNALEALILICLPTPNGRRLSAVYSFMIMNYEDINHYVSTLISEFSHIKSVF